MKLAKITNGLSKLTGRTGLLMQKHGPEILLVTGIVGIIGSTVLACRATLKVDDTLTDAQNKILKIKMALTDEEIQEAESYTKEDHDKDMTIVYVQTAVNFARLYGPSVILGAASIGCIIKGHKILNARNVGLTAALKATSEGFAAYRKRVVEEYGEEKDYMFKNGLRAEEIVDVEVGEDGKPKKVKKTQLVGEVDGATVYARYFDQSTSTNWSSVPEYNAMFIKTSQNYMNDLLKTRGHVFLNEVYDHLGFKRSPAASQVGWVFNGNGDNYIDFGLPSDFSTNCPESVLMDFNVDGPIFDLI